MLAVSVKLAFLSDKGHVAYFNVFNLVHTSFDNDYLGLFLSYIHSLMQKKHLYLLILKYMWRLLWVKYHFF